MKVLVLNSGSSSIKFQLIEMPNEKVSSSGIVERIGSNDAVLTYRTAAKDSTVTLDVPNHQVGLETIAKYLLDPINGAVQHSNEIDAVGHRIVHGGDAYAETTLINDQVKDEIKEFSSLAPLHNPHNLKGVEMAGKIFPDAKQIAVFDTAFHQTMPVKARKYAIPNKFYEEQGIKVYGFHGTSHKYVSEKASEYLKKYNVKLISIHLGNGCSITAVRNGKSIDHSLGFGPNNGLIMGSRSGDIDHTLIFYLVNELGYTLNQVNNLLIKESGMQGLTGYSDLRDIQVEAENGNAHCKLALEMNAYRIKKYIGAYTAAMNGLDAIVFTAGIGENSALLRSMVCSDMQYLGIEFDDSKNALKSSGLREIQSSTSTVKILIIPTNEELEIAKQAFQLLNS